MEGNNLLSFDEIDTIYGGMWTNNTRPCESPAAFKEIAYVLTRMEGTRSQWQIARVTVCQNEKKREILETELNVWDGVKLLRNYTEELRASHNEIVKYAEISRRLYSALDSHFNSGGWFGEYGLPAIEKRLCVNKPEPKLPSKDRHSLTGFFIKMNDQEPK